MDRDILEISMNLNSRDPKLSEEYLTEPKYNFYIKNIHIICKNLTVLAQKIIAATLLV
jgi:hypothetical protein